MLPERLSSATVRVARAANHRWTRSIRLAEPAWDALSRELDIWQARGQCARFWWRDDDAEDLSPALEVLLASRDYAGVPLAIAVIPVGASERLAVAVRPIAGVRILQHGWDHQNHAPAGKPRGEFAEGRNPQDVAAELAKGRGRLQMLFGPQCLPVLVPPHNFLARSLSGIVADEGFHFVSVEGDFTGLPIACRNVHIDPIDWRLVAANGEGTLVRQALSALRLRRFGLLSPASPIGIVTHHLKHDADIWQSTARLLSCLTAHPSAAFPPLAEIFAP
jgi:hypothetical protein